MGAYPAHRESEVAQGRLGRLDLPRTTEMIRILEKADPADKNDLYMQMGLHLVYDPTERVVLVEARPSMYQSACPRGT